MPGSYLSTWRSNGFLLSQISYHLTKFVLGETLRDLTVKFTLWQARGSRVTNSGITGAWTSFRDGWHATRDAARDAATVKTYRVAITGLSRAGKTVFLVSLISNLLAMVRGANGQRWNTLPRLTEKLRDSAGNSRLLDVEIEQTGAQKIARFDYESLRDKLAGGDEPAWPPSTSRQALITLRLQLGPKRTKAILGSRLIRLELLDYPGEWLLDLPLLEQSYEAWSAEVLEDLRNPPRAKFAKDFLDFLETLQAGAPGSEKLATHGFHLYRDVLSQCREQVGLRWLQPGRFLMPGSWGDIPLLHFFPWTGAPAPVRGTLGAQLRDRFEAYKSEMRRDFFDPHFNAFNRQLVLVDVLGALFAGKTAFEDTSRALHRIGESYTRLLEGGRFTGRKIDAVAFVATKSDHVDDLQRDNLRLTLEHMVLSGPKAAKGNTKRTFHAVSAVRCTTDADVTDPEGRVHRAVLGVPLGDTRQRPFRAGHVPAGAVRDTYWTNPYFEMPVLRPPDFRGGDAYPIDQMNLDEVLVALLGDVL
jgi:uncharacterized protein